MGNIHTSAAVVAAALIGVAAVVTAQPNTARIRLTLASLILPAAGLTVALRPNHPETSVSAIYFAIVCCVMALVVSRSSSRPAAIVSLVDGIGLLLCAAVVLRYAGVGKAGNLPVIMGNFLTGGERVMFPLAGSLTSGPALAAAYLVAAIPLMTRTRRYRGYRLLGVAAAVYVLIQGDRRSALFSVIVLLALVLLAPRVLRRIAPWVIGFLLTAPFTIQLLGGLPQQFNLSTIQRAGELNSESLNNRLEIWHRSLNYYNERFDLYRQTFGFGTSGQISSGASFTYRGFFIGTEGSSAKSSHHSAVQALFDGGWIVALCLVVTIIVLAVTTARRSSITDLASLAMLTSLSIVGSTETVLAPGYPGPIWWTLVAIAMIALARDEKAHARPDASAVECKS